jgi:molecular chaperone DnaK
MLHEKKCPQCGTWSCREDDFFCGYCGAGLFILHIDNHNICLSFRKHSDTKEVVLRNKGINPSTITISLKSDSSYPQWLSIDKEKIHLKEQEILTLSLNTDYIDTNQTYSSQLVVTSEEIPLFSPHFITVTFEKMPEPLIFPEEIILNEVPLGAEEKGEIEIANQGDGSLKLLSITVPDFEQWLSVLLSDNSTFPDITSKSTFKIKYHINTQKLTPGFHQGKILFHFKELEEPYEVSVSLETISGPRLHIMNAEELVHDGKIIHHMKEKNIPGQRKIIRDIYIKNSGDGQLRVYRIKSQSPALIVEEYDEIILNQDQEKRITLYLNTSQCPSGLNEFSIILYSNDKLQEEAQLIYAFEILDKIPEMDEFIGIDFGTSNSCVAYIFEDDKEPQLIKFDGKKFMPSVLFFEKPLGEEENIMIGEKALRMMAVYPQRSVRALKRVLGTNSKRTFFGKAYSATDLASLIIKEIVEQTEDELIKKGIIKRPKKAILTVPANYFDAQIRAILEASQRAGLNPDEKHDKDACIIIDEPSAAAMYYIYKKYVQLQHKPESEIIVVYDFGGGTLDVSLIEIFIEKRKIEIIVHSTKGNNRMGGVDVDRLIINYIAEHIKERYHDFDKESVTLMSTQMKEQYLRYGQDTYNKILSVRNSFKSAAENIKIELSSRNEVKQSFVELVDKNKFHQEDIFLRNSDSQMKTFTITINRDELNKVIKDLIDDSIQLIEQALTLARMRKENINTVLFTGGTTKIPYIKKRVKEFFNDKPVFYDDNHIPPKTCVAMGAAYWGYIRNKPGVQIQFIGQTRLPFSYGIKIIDFQGPIFDTIIPAGESYPVTKTHHYPQEYFKPNVDTIFEVLQNNSDNNKIFNNPFIRKLGKIKINPLADNEPGANVVFKINQNRILEVNVDGKEISIEPDYEELDDEGY